MSQNKKIFIFEDSHKLTNYLLKRWIELSAQKINDGKNFTAAFSGGKTPIEFYCKLSGLKSFELWKNTHIFLTDERFVPMDQEDSNYGMMRSNLFNDVTIPFENIHFISTDEEDAALAAQKYQMELLDFFNLKIHEFPIFDFMLLGLGVDGHVASLFPDFENCYSADKMVMATESVNFSHSRISLTLPVLNHAQSIFFIVTGENKAKIVKEILEEKRDCPATRVQSLQGEVVYLLDKGASSQLTLEDSYSHEDFAIVFNR